MTGKDQQKEQGATTNNPDGQDTTDNQAVAGETAQRSQEQQSTQQDQNSQFAIMQQQIAMLQQMLANQQAGISNQQVQNLDPRVVRTMPGYTPPSHAADSLTRINVNARKMEYDMAKVDLPAAAEHVSVLDAHYVDMPPGGLATLAEHLYLDDFANKDAMAGHVHDLLMMNRDRLRDDTSHPVGVRVRVK